MNGNDNNGQPLDIIVQGTPITKGSVQPWRTKHGKTVSVDARLQSWEAAIRGTAVSMMTASGLKPYDCPISITGEIRVPRTDKLHDLPAWQTAKTSGGGDLDKLQRAIGDALQTTNSRYPGRNREGVISNDSRIIHWQISKRYADETRPEGVYLTIRPISTPELPDWQPATPAGRTIHDNLQRRSQRLADMLRQHPTTERTPPSEQTQAPPPNHRTPTTESPPQTPTPHHQPGTTKLREPREPMSTIINTTGHTTGITLTDADWNTTHIENGDSRITILAHTDEYPQLVSDLALHLTTITPNPGIRQTAQALAEAINQGA